MVTISTLRSSRSGSLFFNYIKYCSILLMAIADAQYRLVVVDIGAFGCSNDLRVFKNSAMGRRLYSGNFSIPSPRLLPRSEGPPMPFVLVSDEAFQMCGNLVKPYSSRGLNYRKRIFNYRHGPDDKWSALSGFYLQNGVFLQPASN